MARVLRLLAAAASLSCALCASSPGAAAGVTARVQERIRVNFNFYLHDACGSAACVLRVRTALAAAGCGDMSDPRTSVYLPNVHFVEAECRARGALPPDEVARRAALQYPGLIVSQEKNFACSFHEGKPKFVGRGHLETRGILEQRMSQRVRGLFERGSTTVREKQVFPDVYEYWNLDRLDQVEAGFDLNRGVWLYDKVFDYGCFPAEGAGSTIYVIDTGCNIDHEDLDGGRVESHADLTRFPSSEDDNGHGTHVASIAAGKYSGVCKKCKLVCVKAVPASGEGSSGDIVAAMDWAIQRHKTTSPGQPAVAVIALGAKDHKITLDEGVQRLSEAGIIPVVAAANFKEDACSYTPARSPFSITVGATDMGDNILFTTNWGSCVNVMAPGYMVTGAGHSTSQNEGVKNTVYDSRQGTSQATPHVAGVIALILAEKRMSQADVLAMATHGGKTISYSKGGASFSHPLVHILKDHCSDYGFPTLDNDDFGPVCGSGDDLEAALSPGEAQDFDGC